MEEISVWLTIVGLLIIFFQLLVCLSRIRLALLLG